MKRFTQIVQEFIIQGGVRMPPNELTRCNAMFGQKAFYTPLERLRANSLLGNFNTNLRSTLQELQQEQSSNHTEICKIRGQIGIYEKGVLDNQEKRKFYEDLESLKQREQELISRNNYLEALMHGLRTPGVPTNQYLLMILGSSISVGVPLLWNEYQNQTNSLLEETYKRVVSENKQLTYEQERDQKLLKSLEQQKKENETKINDLQNKLEYKKQSRWWPFGSSKS